MKIIILNFKRSGVDSVIETLNLTEEILQEQNLSCGTNTKENKEQKVVEIQISDFFSATMYSTLKEAEYLNSSTSVGGGGILSPLIIRSLIQEKKNLLKL